MADRTPGSEIGLLNLPLEVLTDVCLQLELRDLLCLADACERLRHGDGGRETEELPTKSAVVTALLEHAFPGGAPIPSTRPASSESWVAYLARCARQRLCRETPLVAAGVCDSLFVDAAGQLLVCGDALKMGRAHAEMLHLYPAPAAATVGVRVRSMAAGQDHNLALGWNGRIYSWGGSNMFGQLGRGERDSRNWFSPALVEGLEGVCSIAAGCQHSLAATESGDVYSWGMAMTYDAFAEDEDEDDFEPLPTIVDGFEGVRVRRVYAHALARFAIGEAGELFSWGLHDGETLGCGGDEYQGTLGHGDLENQPSPKRLEALRGVRVSCVSVESEHGLALAESGLVYAWGYISLVTPISSDTSCSLTMELVPKPVEALRGVRVGSIAQGFERSYAVADSGELWTWAERDEDIWPMLAHGEQIRCPVPKTIEALQGCKVYAVDASESHTLALADNGSVYAWANDSYYKYAAGPGLGLLCLTDAGRVAGEDVQTLQRISALRVACGL